ncbi:hypothetical protein [Absidia glauca]|uniref:Uncharacterized protein n=1 Tax=Absidia glauca TaxID=4829 RepID=A0A163KE72_ABSGL|nr:hypothetical protein [Absidia glauca]
MRDQFAVDLTSPTSLDCWYWTIWVSITLMNPKVSIKVDVAMGESAVKSKVAKEKEVEKKEDGDIEKV